MGANVNQADKNGITTIYAAAVNGHLSTVLHLLECGEDFHKTHTDVIADLENNFKFFFHRCVKIIDYLP